ncbi:unnamed protein product [Notodromas monacha]|uniref:SSD domain-containing protein n=1 Tax=Notodromas monacha TaxID=399045 RepID=A0A7R9GGH9_9CRUS|nr:unnamed protein product [Notodromas monacha]CAG0920213.1 unnamed protein product [Notodromas monacha]
MKVIPKFLTKLFELLGSAVGRYPWVFIALPLAVFAGLATGLRGIAKIEDYEFLFTPSSRISIMEQYTMGRLFWDPFFFSEKRLVRGARHGKVIITAKDGGTILRKELWDEIMSLHSSITAMEMTWSFDEKRGRVSDDEVKRKRSWSKSYESSDSTVFQKICFGAVTTGCHDNGGILALYPVIGDVETGKIALTYPTYTLHDVPVESRAPTDDTSKGSPQDKAQMTMKLGPFYAYHARRRQLRRTIDIDFTATLGGLDLDNVRTESGQRLRVVTRARAIKLAYYVGLDDPRMLEWERKFVRLCESLTPTFSRIDVSYVTSSSLLTQAGTDSKDLAPYIAATFLAMIIFSIVTNCGRDCVRAKPMVAIGGVVSTCCATAAAFGLCRYCGVLFTDVNLAAPFLMLGIGMDDTYVMLSSWGRTSLTSPVAERMSKVYADVGLSITITSLTDLLSYLVGAFTPFPAVRFFCIYSAASVAMTFAFHVTFFGAILALAGRCEQRNLHNILCCVRVQPRSRNPAGCCVGGIDPTDPENELNMVESPLGAFFRDHWAPLLALSWVKVAATGKENANVENLIASKRMKAIDELTSELESLGSIDASGTEYSFRAFRKSMDEQYCEGISELLTGAFELPEDIVGLHFTNFVRHKPIPTIWDVANFRNHIVALRIVFRTNEIRDQAHGAKVMNEVRRICKEMSEKTGLEFLPFSVQFLFFDQFDAIRLSTIASIGSAAAVMMVLFFLLIPDLMAALWVAVSIASIEAGVVGYMALWGVPLDVISMITIIMCIGFSVDFSAHVSYAYVTSQSKGATERTADALHKMGGPVFKGAASTLVGIAALAFMPSQMFRVFFKTVFLVMVIGCLHGLLFLPVLLQLFAKGVDGDGKGSNVEDEGIFSPSGDTTGIPSRFDAGDERRIIQDLNHGMQNNPNSEPEEIFGESLNAVDEITTEPDEHVLNVPPTADNATKHV